MAGFLPADEPVQPIASEIDDDSTEDSEILHAKVKKILRKSRLASIASYKQRYLFNKALGLPTTDTPLSIIEETFFEDSIPEMEEWVAAVGDGGSSADARGEKAMEMDEYGSAQNIEAPLCPAVLGFSDSCQWGNSEAVPDTPLSEIEEGTETPLTMEGDEYALEQKSEAPLSPAALGFPDPSQIDPSQVEHDISISEIEEGFVFADTSLTISEEFAQYEAKALEYDRARIAELDPRTVDMMRLLLPRYFEVVRSFL